jgi:hypothetical protein
MPRVLFFEVNATRAELTSYEDPTAVCALLPVVRASQDSRSGSFSDFFPRDLREETLRCVDVVNNAGIKLGYAFGSEHLGVTLSGHVVLLTWPISAALEVQPGSPRSNSSSRMSNYSLFGSDENEEEEEQEEEHNEDREILAVPKKEQRGDALVSVWKRLSSSLRCSASSSTATTISATSSVNLNSRPDTNGTKLHADRRLAESLISELRICPQQKHFDTKHPEEFRLFHNAYRSQLAQALVSEILNAKSELWSLPVALLGAVQVLLAAFAETSSFAIAFPVGRLSSPHTQQEQQYLAEAVCNLLATSCYVWRAHHLCVSSDAKGNAESCLQLAAKHIARCRVSLEEASQALEEQRTLRRRGVYIRLTGPQETACTRKSIAMVWTLLQEAHAQALEQTGEVFDAFVMFGFAMRSAQRNFSNHATLCNRLTHAFRALKVKFMVPSPGCHQAK